MIAQSYPVGMGWETVDEDEKRTKGRKQLKTFGIMIPPTAKWPNLIHQINVEEGAGESEFNIQISSGLSIPLEIVDSDSRPMIGVETRKLRNTHDYFTTKTSKVNATGFLKNQKRFVLFKHKDRDLGVAAELDASVLDGKEKRETPVQIKLLPWARFVGQIVNNDGDPVPSAAIVCMIGGGRDYGCLLYTSPSPRDRQKSRMPSSA